MSSAPAVRPPTWAFVLAFAAVYLAYGLNYLAIREGVHTLPPFLFAGSHVTLASILLFLWLLLHRRPIGLPWPGVCWAATGGAVVFIGGTGLVTMGEMTVHSGVASVLRATTPVWIGVLEWLRPKGERLNALAWLGLLLAVAGVCVLLIPKLEEAPTPAAELGPVLVLASAFSWAVGALILRHRRPCASNLLATAYQMLFGGAGMILLGLILGEGPQFHAAELTRDAVAAFFFLLIVHSLIGYSALNWLLQHVSAAMATTKFYVSPAIALLAGWLVLGEQLSGTTFAGMALILVGVVLALTHPPASKV